MCKNLDIALLLLSVGHPSFTLGAHQDFVLLSHLQVERVFSLHAKIAQSKYLDLLNFLLRHRGALEDN